MQQNCNTKWPRSLWIRSSLVTLWFPLARWRADLRPVNNNRLPSPWRARGDTRRPCHRRGFIDGGRDWRRGCGALVSLHLGRGDADQGADSEALKPAPIYQVADRAAAASPPIGQLGDRIGPNVMLGQDVAAVSHLLLPPRLVRLRARRIDSSTGSPDRYDLSGRFFGLHSSSARSPASSAVSSWCCPDRGARYVPAAELACSARVAASRSSDCRLTQSAANFETASIAPISASISISSGERRIPLPVSSCLYSLRRNSAGVVGMAIRHPKDCGPAAPQGGARQR